MTNLSLSVKPQVLGLVDPDSASHELDAKNHYGSIYVALGDDTQWALIGFEFRTTTTYSPKEYFVDDGQRWLVDDECHELDKIHVTAWEIVEVEGCNWTPSDSDTAKIENIITEYICEHWEYVA